MMGLTNNMLVKKVGADELERLLPDKQKGTFDAFKAQMQPGDEIWQYNASPLDWLMMRGQKGYVIVRHGRATGHTFNLFKA